MKIRLGLVAFVGFAVSFVLCVVIALAQPAPAFYQPSPTVVGQVVSVSMDGGEWPLSSESGWGLNITLYRYEAQTGQMLWIGSSDCWNNQGCTDQFGNYSFTRDFFGVDLQQDDYEVEVTASGHLVSRTKFHLELSGQTTVRSELRMAPVFLGLLEGTQSIPSIGGPVKARVQIWNLDSQTGTVPASAMIYGPTRTQVYSIYQEELSPLLVPENRWESSEAEMSVDIPSDAPDGRTFCVNFRLGHPSEVVSETWVCAMKGGGPSKIELRGGN